MPTMPAPARALPKVEDEIRVLATSSPPPIPNTFAEPRQTSLVADTLEHRTSSATRALPDLPESEAPGIPREPPGAHLDRTATQIA